MQSLKRLIVMLLCNEPTQKARKAMSDMRIACKRCDKQSNAKELQFLTLPYKKGYPDIIGLCPDCFKEFEAFIYYKSTEQAEKGETV